MKFVKFTQTTITDRVFDEGYGYFNIELILFVKPMEPSPHYPPSTMIAFSDESVIRVDGTIEEVMEKIGGV